MTAHSLRRVDELLVELVETVETARAVPMSGSCVVPRERTLDLLDALHESFPAELTEARQVLAQRDALLADANQVAAQVVADAEVRAHEIMEAGRAEHAELVSASRVHQTAAEQREAAAYGEPGGEVLHELAQPSSPSGPVGAGGCSAAPPR